MNNININKLSIPKNKQSVETIKYDIANEFGINLGPEPTFKSKGIESGDLTKRLIRLGQNLQCESYIQNK